MQTPLNDPAMRLEEAGCTSCGETAGTYIRSVRDHLYRVDPREFKLMRCASCRMVYLSPRPVRADLALAYPPAYFWNGFDLKPARTWRDTAWNLWARQLVLRRVGFLRRAYPQASDLPVLDVGCGRGLFLREWRRVTGVEAHGVDLQPENIRFLRENHPAIQAFHADFLEWDAPQERYGAVTMWHLLEHLPDSRAALRKAHASLAPGGALIVGTQNYRSLSRYLQGSRWTLNDVPRHLSHYTEETLRRQLESEGFAVERVWHWTEFFPTLGAHLFASRILDAERNVKPLTGLVCNVLLSPLEALAIAFKRGCTLTVAARRGD
ncbi:MAG TPA: class I SAM-dependent methyltransferase [Pantanalinema sp.]